MKISKYPIPINLLALVFFLATALGCGKEKIVVPNASLTASEQSELNYLLAAADSLSDETENFQASDSLILRAEPLLKKTGRTKTAYRAHRRQVLNLVSAEKPKVAQSLADSLIRKFALEDDSISALYNGLSGWLYWETGDYRGGIQPLERAASLFEKYGPESKLNGIYNNLGISYGQLGDHEKAIQNYQAALRLNEKNADSTEISSNLYNLALAFLHLGDLQNAEKHNLLGMGFQLERDGSFELQAAEIALARGQNLTALRIVRQLQKNRPDLFDIASDETALENLFALGEILHAVGQHDEAIVCLEKSLAIHPIDPTKVDWDRTKHCFLLGDAFLKTGKPALALPFFQSALQASVPSFHPSDLLENPLADSLPPEVWAMEALRGKTAALNLLSLQNRSGNTKKTSIRQMLAAIESAERAIYLIQKLKTTLLKTIPGFGWGSLLFRNFMSSLLRLPCDWPI
jgi:tetratricopeptide (TPR) repeat protein